MLWIPLGIARRVFFFIDVKGTCHKVVSAVSILYCIKGQYRILFKTNIPLIAQFSVIIRTKFISMPEVGSGKYFQTKVPILALITCSFPLKDVNYIDPDLY